MMLDPRLIARIMGGDVTNRNSINVPGPGHSRTDRSLSIKVSPRAPGGFVVYSHAGDDPIDCRDYVRGRLGLAQWQAGDRRTPLVVTHTGPDYDKERLKRFALRIWSDSVSPTGTIIEHYLREHRGIELGADIAGCVIRFHAGLKYDGAYIPGMVCLFRNIKTNEPCGVHRTFLNRVTAEKIDRRMLGVAKDATIKFDSIGSSGLVIGEGIETVLSARMAGLGPAWALGSSGAVRSFPVIKAAAELTILEENDPTSRRDVLVCARRYLAAKKPVNIVTPSVGNDFNDAWRAAQ